MNFKLFNCIWQLAENTKNPKLTIAKLRSLSKALLKEDSSNSQTCLDAVEYLESQLESQPIEAEQKGKLLALQDLIMHKRSQDAIDINSIYSPPERAIILATLGFTNRLTLEDLKKAKSKTSEQQTLKELLLWRHFIDKTKYSAKEILDKDEYYDNWLNRVVNGEMIG